MIALLIVAFVLQNSLLIHIKVILFFEFLTIKQIEDHLLREIRVLLQQQVDLSTAIDQLLTDFEAGRKYMRVYKQMKMYNDPSTNPILYGKK